MKLLSMILGVGLIAAALCRPAAGQAALTPGQGSAPSTADPLAVAAPAPAAPPPAASSALRDPTEVGGAMRAALLGPAGRGTRPTITLKALAALDGKPPLVVLEVEGQLWRGRPGETLTLANGLTLTLANDLTMKIAEAGQPATGADQPAGAADQPATAAAPAAVLAANPAPLAATPASLTEALGRRMAVLDVRDLPLGEALNVLSEQAGLNVVPSREAAKVRVSIVLRGSSALDALEALSKANQLYFRADQTTGIVQVYTLEEYKRDLGGFRAAEVEVFSLLYPNAVDVGRVIRDLYGERVQLALGGEDDSAGRDLQQRLQRFDLIDGRSQGLGQSGSTTNAQNAFQAGQQFAAGASGVSAYNPVTFPRQPAAPGQMSRGGDTLSESERLALEAQSATRPGSPEAALAEQLLRRQSPIYVTVMPRLSRIVVRTSDEETLLQIRELVSRLDVPTPLVLLEVKVLSVELTDDFQSVFDFQAMSGDFAGGFTTGEIRPPTSPNFSPGGVGVRSDNLVFQVVGSHLRARLQMLEDKNRVTVLATPLLLTAHNEVSRIFDGRTLPIVTGFTMPQTIASDTPVVVPGTPITEMHDVGTSLLIAPSINADRTVTLRLLQEMSDVLPQQGTIPVATTAGGIVNQQIDIVRRRTVSGTLVARDGLAIAVGGLIQEEIRNNRTQVPILGDIPLLGLLFRRQDTARTRSELIVVIRPYVLTTPAESEAASRKLLKELSINPAAGRLTGGLDTFRPKDVPSAAGDGGLRDELRFHGGGEPYVPCSPNGPDGGSGRP